MLEFLFSLLIAFSYRPYGGIIPRPAHHAGIHPIGPIHGPEFQ